MPTNRPDRPRLLAPAAVAVALLLGVSACAGRPPAVTSPDPTTPRPSESASVSESASTPPVVEGLPVPPDLDAAFTRLLDTRARALLERDRVAYLSVLDQSDPGFLVAQEGYFDNLAQLPLATFAYTVDRSSLVRGRQSYSVVVEIATRFEGFDTLTSRTLDRFRFDRVGKRNLQRYRLASVTDRAWEETHAIQSQPWEVRPVQVRRGAGVLAIFDDVSVGAAEPLLRSIEESIADVAGRVPYAWDRTVMVYALSDTDFIRSLDDLPGGDPEALDAVAFTVPAGPGDPRVAATRIVLNPRIVAAEPGPARQQLLRHEITHVAVGERDDNAPVWLAEGLAEWVSVQALPEAQRRIGAAALAAARRGIETMPDDASFNDGEADVHYAVAWFVCEYLARIYGDAAPWAVLDAFAAPGTPESPTIQALVQISVDKLAKRGVALLVRTYEPPAPEEPTETATTGGTPGDEADAG